MTIFASIFCAFMWNCTGVSAYSLESTLVRVIAWCRQTTSHIWAIVDQYFCCRMASLGGNELNVHPHGVSESSVVHCINPDHTASYWSNALTLMRSDGTLTKIFCVVILLKIFFYTIFDQKFVTRQNMQPIRKIMYVIDSIMLTTPCIYSIANTNSVNNYIRNAIDRFGWLVCLFLLYQTQTEPLVEVENIHALHETRHRNKHYKSFSVYVFVKLVHKYKHRSIDNPRNRLFCEFTVKGER